MADIENKLKLVLEKYSESFSDKEYVDEFNDTDVLMDAGGWTKLMADETFKYIQKKTGFDLKEWLIKLKKDETYKIHRK